MASVTLMLANKRLESALLGYLGWRPEDESALQGSVCGFAFLGLDGESRDADISVLPNQFSANSRHVFAGDLVALCHGGTAFEG